MRASSRKIFMIPEEKIPHVLLFIALYIVGYTIFYLLGV